MSLDDDARVHHPLAPYDNRTVTDTPYAPNSTYAERDRPQFPTGEERTCPAAAVTACSRTGKWEGRS